MRNWAVEHDFPLQVAYELMHAHGEPTVGALVYGRRLNPRVNGLPLVRSVVAHGGVARNVVALPGPGPAHLRSKIGYHRRNVAGIEGGVHALQHSVQLGTRMLIHLQVKVATLPIVCH